MKKYPQGCYPFHFDWDRSMDSTMFIEQKRGSQGKPLGMKYFVEVFSLLHGEDRPHKRYLQKSTLVLVCRWKVSEEMQTHLAE